MTLTQLLNRYVQGGPGEYYFNFDLVHGHDISGGLFSRKLEARTALLGRLVAFLDDPQAFLYPGRVRIRVSEDDGE